MRLRLVKELHPPKEKVQINAIIIFLKTLIKIGLPFYI